MKTTRLLLSALLAISLAAPSALSAEVAQRYSAFLQDEGEKHRDDMRQVFFANADVSGDAWLCYGYGNNHNKGQSGTFLAKGTHTRIDEEGNEQILQKVNKRGKLQENKWRRCHKLKNEVLRGDMFVVNYTFSGFPRPKDAVMHIISSLGNEPILIGEIFGPAPKAPEEPAPNPNPNPNPNPGPVAGPLTPADQLAASQLLVQSRRTQLWRFKGNQPEKWTVVGPNTLLGSGLGGINPSTAGYGPTIAAAVADYERKRGALPAGGGLSARDQQALVWYSNMNASAGPTSIRRDGGGGYFGEFYRPGKGAQHDGPFGSIADAVAYFQRNGL